MRKYRGVYSCSKGYTIHKVSTSIRTFVDRNKNEKTARERLGYFSFDFFGFPSRFGGTIEIEKYKVQRPKTHASALNH